MDANRRELLMASLGLGLGAAAVSLLPGCQTPPTAGAGSRPPPNIGQDKYGQRPVPVNPLPPGGRVSPMPLPHDPAPAPPIASAIGDLRVLPRSAWSSVHGPVSDKINPMNGVRHITVHHEGWTVVDFEDQANTIDRLEKIRGAHTRSVRDGGRGWSDIGYHFIIDRAGRIWEARNLKYQGAHVSACNENNLGIMCLGNFDEQTPSQKQLNSLVLALKTFKAEYRVPMGEIFTHQEWKKRCPSTNTKCPGRNLQAQMAGIRRANVIG